MQHFSDARTHALQLHTKPFARETQQCNRLTDVNISREKNVSNVFLPLDYLFHQQAKIRQSGVLTRGALPAQTAFYIRTGRRNVDRQGPGGTVSTSVRQKAQNSLYMSRYRPAISPFRRHGQEKKKKRDNKTHAPPDKVTPTSTSYISMYTSHRSSHHIISCQTICAKTINAYMPKKRLRVVRLTTVPRTKIHTTHYNTANVCIAPRIFFGSQTLLLAYSSLVLVEKRISIVHALLAPSEKRGYN